MKTAKKDISRMRKTIPKPVNRVQTVTKVRPESFEFIFIFMGVKFSRLFSFLEFSRF